MVMKSTDTSLHSTSLLTRFSLLMRVPALASSLLILLTACGGKSGSSKVDTVFPSPDTVAVVADSLGADTIPDYYSDDLRAYGLHGRVRSVRTDDYGPFVTSLAGPLAFSPKGVLTSHFPDLLDNETAKNLKGIIDETECHQANGDEFELEFDNWDEFNNPIAGKYTATSARTIWEVNFNITYLTFDRENNWVSRTIAGEAVTRSLNSKGEVIASQSEPITTTETRTITYYE